MHKTADYPAYLVGCALAFVVASAASCRQLVDFDEYGFSSPGAGGADASSDAPDNELPVLPARPDSARVESCTACVKNKCGDKRSQCLGSERCRDMLECVGGNRCSDPNCIARCTDVLPESGYFWDYFDCAFSTYNGWLSPTVSRCFEECGAGANWGCLGKFRWDDAEPVNPTLQVQVFSALPWGGLGFPVSFEGYEIAACENGDELANPPGETGCGQWALLGLYGDAKLAFVGSGGFLANSFAVRNQATGRWERIYTRPIVRSGPMWLPLFGLNVVDFIIRRGTTPHDPSLGVVSAIQQDCLGIGSPADIQLEEPPAGVIRRCVTDNGGFVDDCSSPSAATFFTNVPPAWAAKVRSTRPDGTEASHRSVLVASHWYTTAILYPMDSDRH